MEKVFDAIHLAPLAAVGLWLRLVPEIGQDMADHGGKIRLIKSFRVGVPDKALDEKRGDVVGCRDLLVLLAVTEVLKDADATLVLAPRRFDSILARVLRESRQPRTPQRAANWSWVSLAAPRKRRTWGPTVLRFFMLRLRSLTIP
jgi:hypothetical protein